MKKVSVVLQDKDIQQALVGLGNIGVLHLEHFSVPKGGELDALKDEHTRVQQVVGALERTGPRPKQASCSNAGQVFLGAEAALRSIKVQEQSLQDLQAQVLQWEPWGAFDLYDIEQLREQGIHVRLLSIPESQVAALPDDLMAERISSADGMARVVVCSRDATAPGLDGGFLPEYSLRKLKELRHDARGEKERLEQRLRESAQYLDELGRHLRLIENRIARQQALAGRHVEDGLTIMRGYCPVDTVERFKAEAIRRQWAWFIDDPAEGDPVPTLLRNPRWVELIKPVFGMISVLPGYKEHDVSPVFMLFFSLFFGILIGDAGYGLFFGLLTAVIHLKLGSKLQDKSPIYLMYILSSTTMFWGLLTGTVLGHDLFPGITPLVPWLSVNANVERLCFFIGATHLSIAHIWRGILKWPSISALAEVGWLCLLWGMFALARLLVLGEPMSERSAALFVVGPALVAVFTRPNRNPLRMLGSGLASLAMNAVNTFTDVVSYIRLFAVGLATVAVADAFNGMAMQLGFGSPLAGFLTALILVAGHAFNMVLGAMAILVHGLRLNVLEFSSHMNLEWAGIKYEPFRNLKGDK